MGEGLKRARKAAKATRGPPRTHDSLVTERRDYQVDGGNVLDSMSGTSRIDLVGEEIGAGCRRAVSLFVSKEELCLYPIGAKVRVTIERIT